MVILRRCLLFLLVLLALPYGLAIFYRFIPPPSMPMMLRWLSGKSVERQWVPLAEISPFLVRAVITSEDAGFCRHFGIDPGAIRDALRQAEARDGPLRGAST